MFTCFDRMYERDRQTDTHTHTDIHRMKAKATLDASITWQKNYDNMQAVFI